jgi:ATP-dependent DNA helicase RecQ
MATSKRSKAGAASEPTVKRSTRAASVDSTKAAKPRRSRAAAATSEEPVAKPATQPGTQPVTQPVTKTQPGAKATSGRRSKSAAAGTNAAETNAAEAHAAEMNAAEASAAGTYAAGTYAAETYAAAGATSSSAAEASATATLAPPPRPTVDGLLALGRSVLGITDYRPGQRQALEHILADRDVIAVMPTGSGKSLLYQLPSLVLPGLTVVVSPLIALIKDQVDKMVAKGVAVVRIDSTLTIRQRREMDALARAPGGKLLLTTPERMADPEFRTFLRTCAGTAGVSRFVVDEAHCVSQWGHDFRPAYLSLRKALEDVGRPPVLATTATAPPHVRADIVEQLGIESAEIVTTTFDRPNLHYEVITFPGEDDKVKVLVTLLKKLPRPGIVYCATVKKVEDLYESLGRHGIPVAKYHGRMTKTERDAEQERFMAGKDLVMLATNAFGLGVDKKDVRNVLHYHVPGSLEAYAQEAGRGGRDGKPTRCVLLFSPDDVAIQEYFLSGTYPTRRQVKAVYDSLCAYQGHDDGTPANAANVALGAGVGAQRTRTVLSLLKDEGFIVEKDEGVYGLADPPLPEELLMEKARQYEGRRIADRRRLDALLAYVKAPGCRNQTILDYLGEPGAPACGRCDNCLRSRDAALAAASEASVLGARVTRQLDEEGAGEVKPRKMAKHRVVRIDQPPAEVAPAAPPPAPAPAPAPAVRRRADVAVAPRATPAPAAVTSGAMASRAVTSTGGAATVAPRTLGTGTPTLGTPSGAPGPAVRRRPDPGVAGRPAAGATPAAPAAGAPAPVSGAAVAGAAVAGAAVAGAAMAGAADAPAAVPAPRPKKAAGDDDELEDDDEFEDDDDLDDEDDLDDDDLDDDEEDDDDLDDEDDDEDDDDEDDDDLDDEDDEDDDEDDDDEDDDEDDDDYEVIDKTAAELAEEGHEGGGEITVLARKRQPKPPKVRPPRPDGTPDGSVAAEARRRRRKRRRKRRAMLPRRSEYTTPVLTTASPSTTPGGPTVTVLRRTGATGGPLVEYVRGPMRINMAPVASAAPGDPGGDRGPRRRGRDRWQDRNGRPMSAAERRAERRAERLEKRRRRRRRKGPGQGAATDGPVSFFSPIGGPRPALPPAEVGPRLDAPPRPDEPIALGPDGQPLPRKRRRRRRRGRGGRGRPERTADGAAPTPTSPPPGDDAED